MATPITRLTSAASLPRARAGGDRRLRLDDILKLMVADGLVGAADAERAGALAHARSTTIRSELVAEQKLEVARSRRTRR